MQSASASGCSRATTSIAARVLGPRPGWCDVTEHTTVSYRDGTEAALKLAEALRKDEGTHERAQMMAQMGRIIEVVRTFIPAERWPDVQAALRGEPLYPSRHRRRLKGCAWWLLTTARTRMRSDTTGW